MGTTAPGPQAGGDDASRATPSFAEAGRFVSSADRLGYVPPLDGMRGLGVMLVLFVHGAFEPFGSFAATVDMFFVVSGFLITSLILEEDRRSGRVSLRNFYQRRILRLFPLMYLVLFSTLVAFFLLNVLFDEPELWKMAVSDVIAGGTYMYHVIHPVHHELVGGGAAPIRPLIQLWSLTVEEHFYVFGVLVVLFVVRRNWVTMLMVVFSAAWVGIGIARLSGAVGPNFMWYQRPDAILIGVVLAFANARMPVAWSPTTTRWMRHATTAAVLICAAVVFVGTVFAKPFGIHVPFLVPEGGSLHDGLYWGEFGFTLVSACVAIMVITFVRVPEHWAARLLSWKFFRMVGTRSYAIYLIHVPLGVLFMETLGRKVPALTLLLYLPTLVVLTELAHRFVEKPMMRMKLRFAEPAASGTSGRPD